MPKRVRDCNNRRRRQLDPKKPAGGTGKELRHRPHVWKPVSVGNILAKDCRTAKSVSENYLQFYRQFRSMPATPDDLFAFLDGLGIPHKTVAHAPLFTVEQSQALRG